MHFFILFNWERYLSSICALNILHAFRLAIAMLERLDDQKVLEYDRVLGFQGLSGGDVQVEG